VPDHALTICHAFKSVRHALADAACQPEITSSRQFFEQSLCLFEVRRIETFGEPAVNRCQKIAGSDAMTLVTKQSGEAQGGAQLPKLSSLLLRNAQGFAI
jgi:hypothetical protein